MTWPNTQLEERHIRPKLVLCAGEDPDEYLSAITNALGAPEFVSAYRCYRFWANTDTLFAWTGIGTGCVEPLLAECSRVWAPERIVLVGTAGLTEHSELSLGDCRPIAHAYPRACAVNALGLTPDKPLLPRPGIDETQPHAVGASSDFYYLETGTDSTPGVDFIDMETAQFYYLCERLWGQPGTPTEFVAIKGAANRIGHPEEQNEWGPRVLKACVKLASDWIA